MKLLAAIRAPIHARRAPHTGMAAWRRSLPAAPLAAPSPAPRAPLHARPPALSTHGGLLSRLSWVSPWPTVPDARPRARPDARPDARFSMPDTISERLRRYMCMTSDRLLTDFATQNRGTVRPPVATVPRVSLYNPSGLDYAAIRQSYIDVVTDSDAWASLDDFTRLLLYLLMDNGLRVSEVTDTRAARVLDDSLVLIWQHKTQSFRTARHRASSMGFSLEDFQSRLRRNCQPRFFIYRLLKSCGVVYHTEGRQRDAVTHVFRRLLALTVWQETQSLASVQVAIGHRSLSSTIAYLDEALRLAPQQPRRRRLSHDDAVRIYLKTNKSQ